MDVTSKHASVLVPGFPFVMLMKYPWHVFYKKYKFLTSFFTSFPPSPFVGRWLNWEENVTRFYGDASALRIVIHSAFQAGFFFLYISSFVFFSLAVALDHSKDPCKNEKDFIPDTSGKTYVFYIEMKHASDWTTWNNVARCLHIWDLDVRGFHKSMWRLWLKGNHILIVGSPASPYAKHKSNDVKPLFIPKKT